MKFKNVITLTILATIGTLSCIAQEIKTEKSGAKSYLLFSTGMYSTSFKSKNVADDPYKTVDKKNGVSLGMSYQKIYNSFFGVSIGLNYSTYSQTVYQKGAFEKKNQVDRENYTYDLLMISKITEEYSVGLLEVPLMLKFMTGDQSTLYGFAEVGIVYGQFISKSYEKKGTLENQGKYPWNVSYVHTLSHDNPYYGREEIGFTEGSQDVFRASNLSGRIALGISAVASENLTLSIAPTYTFGLFDIYNKDIQEQDYQNVFGDNSAYEPTKLSSFGFSIGFLLAI